MGRYKHGMNKTATHNTWCKMRQRCNNPKSAQFKYYGERGIVVCERWDGPSGFENFLADMGERPSGMTIERIDNERGYAPDNCRWATHQEQCLNRRSNRRSDFGGESLTQTEIAARTGRHKGTIYRRMRLGFTAAQIASPHKLTGKVHR